VISFLVDQNFNEHIVDGMTRRDAMRSWSLPMFATLVSQKRPIPWCWNARRRTAWFC
jgi:hypothetical protein